MSGGSPFQGPTSAANDFLKITFVIQQLLRGLATATIVRVEACTNAGGLVPGGTVDVTPMVNQVDGAGQPVPHTTIYGLPYQRAQGGACAVIMDPVKGDLGIAVFATRDISAVKTAKGPANPASNRTFDYADGMYIGGLLNGVPTQYVQMLLDGSGNPNGIKVVSPVKITLQAPTVEIDASTEFHVVSPDSEFSATIHTPGTITGDTDVVGNGTHLHTHVHSGVTPGSGDSGPPV